MRVRVYRNLHTGTLSMQAYNKEKKGWRVISHPFHVQLKDVKFVVKESGRQRVIKERRKNVHAWIEGDLVFQALMGPLTGKHYQRKARYNPYKYCTWVGENDVDMCARANWSFVNIDSDGVVSYAPTTYRETVYG